MIPSFGSFARFMSPPGRLISPAPAVDPAPAGAEAPARAPETANPASDFIAALCAEVQAGLQGVLAVTELLQREPENADNPAYLRTISDCGQTLLRLVADAAALSRAQVAPVPPSPQPVRLRDLLDAVQTAWSDRAVADGVGLGAMFSGDAALAAELDPERLRQVYDLLIGHALRLTRRGGVEVGLCAEREGDRVRLRGQVLDTGPGFDPAQLSALFEPFGAAARAPYGTGLDLALARSLVASMGGRIWAENNAGAGATIFFQFEAKVSGAGADAADDADGEEPEPRLAGRILVVDDNATNRIVAKTLVELLGCTCETVEDGVEAVAAVTRGGFDAVLMDIRMPRMDGVAATRAIRALAPPLGDIPIIALTANADAEDARAYRAAGMAELVEKPIKPERLLLALGQALSTKPPKTARAAA